MSTVPRSFERPPPSWPAVTPRCSVSRARHWSASVLRSTSTSVEVARRAISAQAMTVLPDPGGATSTPWSCGEPATARPGRRASVAVSTNCCGVPPRADRRSPAALPASLTTVAAGPASPRGGPAAVEGLVVAVHEPRDAPGREASPLPVVEGRVRHGRRMLERREQRRGELRSCRPRRPAASCTMTTGAGRGRVPDAVAGTSLVDGGTHRRGRPGPASRSTSRGDSRCSVDR